MQKQCIELPEKLPHHWETDSGFKLAVQYSKQDRISLYKGYMSDTDLVLNLEKSIKSDTEFMMYQIAIKERIRWLSVHLAMEQINCSKLLEKLNFPDISYEISNIDPHYATLTREDLPLVENSDFVLANMMYFCNFYNPKVDLLVDAAKNRILWLSAQLKIFSTRKTYLMNLLSSSDEK